MYIYICKYTQYISRDFTCLLRGVTINDRGVLFMVLSYISSDAGIETSGENEGKSHHEAITKVHPEIRKKFINIAKISSPNSQKSYIQELWIPPTPSKHR